MIDGKKRNCRNRKNCFECSPFGVRPQAKPRNCVDCDKQMLRKNEKGKRCWSCTNKVKRESKIAQIKTLLGDACWICGYSGCWSALEFHHVHPEDKLFMLTTRELQYSWNRIAPEIKKCALLCCRCHREHHAGLISAQDIEKLWVERWSNIDIEATIKLPLPPKQCVDCGREILQESTRCNPCASKLNKTTKITWPSNEDLISMVENSSWEAAGRELNVSSNAIRKRLKRSA